MRVGILDGERARSVEPDLMSPRSFTLVAWGRAGGRGGGRVGADVIEPGGGCLLLAEGMLMESAERAKQTESLLRGQ